MKRDNRKSLKRVLFWGNISALFLGALSLIFPNFVLLSQIFGLLLILVLVADSFLALVDENDGPAAGIFLAVSAVSLGILPFVLFLRSGLAVESPFLRFLTLTSVFLPVILGAFLTKTQSPTKKSAKLGLKRPKAIIAVALFLLTLFQMFFHIRILQGQRSIAASIFLPMILPYFALSVLFWGTFSARLYQKSGLARGRGYSLILPALAAFVIGFVPFFQIPATIQNAEADFEDRFGVSASEVESQGAPRAAFDMGKFFLGSKAPEIKSELDIPYLSETNADGLVYNFCFDHFGPKEEGEHPVLIRIHGGAWVTGDKGALHKHFENYLFAKLGYEVFDVQYGLNDEAEFSLGRPIEGMMGPFSVNDMLRQLSSFSTYLADNAEFFGADLSLVFVSGDSAGGQLALALVLSEKSGLYAGTEIGIDPRLKVEGLMLYYPAVETDALGINGDDALIKVTPLISSNNPPAIVFQGENDNLVSWESIMTFESNYNLAGGGLMQVIDFPVSGHAGDLIQWGIYNQIFSFYATRFLTWAQTPENNF